MGETKPMGKQQKFIFVTGGVLSGVGKGISAASIGAVLQAKGLSVSIQKCDPYLNVDAGLLNPAEHGECFVTIDGAETDLDLGHYERFLDLELTQKNATLSGRLLQNLINDERAGKFGGKTVQLVPHLTGAIQDAIELAADGADVHIVEIGGTVGDYEGLSFVEAIREFSGRVGRENCLYVHVVYVPFIGTSKEFKSKPAQNALMDLRGFGIVPDCVIVRTDEPAPTSIAHKISQFSGVSENAVVQLANASTVFQVPITIASSGIHDVISAFTSNHKQPDLSKWEKIVVAQNTQHDKRVTVGLVAKYVDNEDTYISVLEALKAAGWQESVGVDIKWINAESLEKKKNYKFFENVDGILVPGGFGKRGIEGKIKSAKYARENKIPYLGICLGMQMAIVEIGRNVLKLKGCHSSEFSNPTNPVIGLMTEWIRKNKIEKRSKSSDKGGTMRLGSYPCAIKSNTLAYNIYSKKRIDERHRHRYEVNTKYLKLFEKNNFIFSGISPNGKLPEIFEYSSHPWFLGVQFHPELKSRPLNPHPIFVSFVKACIDGSK